MGSILILVVTFSLMWVLFILPQQRRVKRHRELVASLAVGDEVVTTAGMRGRITNLDDELAHIEIAEGVVVRFARGAVASKVDPVAGVDEALHAGAVDAEVVDATDAVDDARPDELDRGDESRHPDER